MNKTPGILIVEDEAIVAMTMELELKNSGFHITGTTGNGEEAVRLFSANPADIVLMDVQLNGTVNGLESAMQIRRLQDVPIVFMTGFSEDSDLFDGITGLGNRIHILEKPIEMYQLISLLHRISPA